MSDSISLTAGALLETLTRRIERNSEDQHRLAAERAVLEEQVRLLRIGITTPDAVLIALRTKGVSLRGITVWTNRETGRVRLHQ